MSNLKKDLYNAKARLKAAQKKLSKLESSNDNQAIAIAQSKVDLEREIIEDIEKRLLEPDNVTAIVRNEDGSLKEIVEDNVANNAPSNSKKRKRDLPQISFRTEEERYQDLKLHYQNPASHHLSSFDNLADMTRTLNLADLAGDIHFIIKRTHQQLARFIDAAQSDKSVLSESEKQMLRNTFINFYADSDADRTKLIEKLENLHQFIKSLDLYRFEE